VLKNNTTMKKENFEFNIVISGVGGQGLITLLKVIAEAAIAAKYEVRSSELHGLSQRGGSVEAHLRFGDKIYSPLVKAGGADLIISLEAQEALWEARYSSKEKTVFLINDFFQPIPGNKLLTIDEITKPLEKISNKVVVVPASQECRESLGTDVVSGIYLLGYLVYNGLLPIKPEIAIEALKKSVPEEFLEMNIKACNLPRKAEA